MERMALEVRREARPTMPYNPPEERRARCGVSSSALSSNRQLHCGLWSGIISCSAIWNPWNWQEIIPFLWKSGMWEDLTKEAIRSMKAASGPGISRQRRGYARPAGIWHRDERRKAKQIARQAYDHARRVGIIRMGFFPFWYRPA